MNHEYHLTTVTWASHREALLAVRHPVFVEEQKVPASIEVDEHDSVSIHVLAQNSDCLPIGTARLLPEGKIGRVAVLKRWRKLGIGRAMMRYLIELARERGDHKLSLHAQTSTTPFYQSLGFEKQGKEFEEAGIPHVKMQLLLD